MTIKELSDQSGFSVKMLRAKCGRLGINADCNLTKDMIESLSSFIIFEKKETFILIPSKMNTFVL